MDISKLPRLSKTDSSESPGPASASNAIADASGRPHTPDPPGYANSWCPQCGAPLVAGAKFCNSCGAIVRTGPVGSVPGAGIEAWISIGMGLFLLFIFPNFVRWTTHKLFNSPLEWPAVTDGEGNEIPYLKSYIFWSDLCIFCFCAVLLLDGIVLLLMRKQIVVAIMFTLTLLTVLLNLGYIVVSYSTQSFALASGLAVLIGGFMCYFQWNLFQSIRHSRAAQLRVA